MEFKNLPQSSPFLNFQDYYLKAEEHGEKFIEAGCISSVDNENKPHSRFVNFKYFFEDNLIFFSSYKSKKADNFSANNNICVNFWWPSIETQVRIEGTISKCEEKFSDEHFFGRDAGKNIAAMVSNQSEEIESYELLKEKI
jgi:Pyridoxamine-phosphate oxidase